MPYVALVGAFVGAVIGAVIWAVICGATGVEVGYVAWAIGGLVGGGAALCGGRGPVSGGTCALLALVSIFAGKMWAAEYVVEGSLREQFQTLLTQEAFAESVSDADRFATVTSKDQYARFMIDFEYTAVTAPEEVTPEEVDDFETYVVPYLRRLNQEKPTLETWQKEREDELVDATMENLPLHEIIFENLNFIDIIFALLGVVTAFRLGRGREEMISTPPPSPN
jgi:hypothetical protein